MAYGFWKMGERVAPGLQRMPRIFGASECPHFCPSRVHFGNLSFSHSWDENMAPSVFPVMGAPPNLVMELRWVVSWALVLLTRGRAVTDVGFKRQGPNDIRISHHNRYAPSHNPDSSHLISSHQSIPHAFPIARLVDLHWWTDWKLATAKLTPSRSGWPNLEKTESSHT